MPWPGHGHGTSRRTTGIHGASRRTVRPHWAKCVFMLCAEAARLRVRCGGRPGNISSRQPRAEVRSIQRVRRRFSRHRRMGASGLRGGTRTGVRRRDARRSRERARLTTVVVQSARARRTRDHARWNARSIGGVCDALTDATGFKRAWTRSWIAGASSFSTS